MQKGFPFSTSSVAFVYWFIDDSHSDRCEIISHCGFKLHFFWWLVMLNIFSCVYWPSECPLWISEALCPFFNRIVCFCRGVEFCKFFIAPFWADSIVIPWYCLACNIFLQEGRWMSRLRIGYYSINSCPFQSYRMDGLNTEEIKWCALYPTVLLLDRALVPVYLTRFWLPFVFSARA